MIKYARTALGEIPVRERVRKLGKPGRAMSPGSMFDPKRRTEVRRVG